MKRIAALVSWFTVLLAAGGLGWAGTITITLGGTTITHATTSTQDAAAAAAVAVANAAIEKANAVARAEGRRTRPLMTSEEYLRDSVVSVLDKWAAEQDKSREMTLTEAARACLAAGKAFRVSVAAGTPEGVCQ